MSEQGGQEGAWTVARLLAWTREYFRQHGVESPRLCAEILLAHALGCERIELYTRHQHVPPGPALATFRQTVREAAAGRPIAYLTGTKEFFSLTFRVTPDVLIPRPETEVLVERTIHLVRHSAGALGSILDVGTGSGCIAVALARNLPDVRIGASDISEAALAVARDNAERLGVAERIDFRCGDLFEPWPAGEPFDVIVSNPPYVAADQAADLPATVRAYEPHEALFAGAAGLDVIGRLAAEAPGHLTADGHLLIEVAFDQAPRVGALLDESGWNAIVAYKDALQFERVIHARRPAREPRRIS